METHEQRDPRLGALALKMQSVCYDLARRVVGEQLDIKQLTVGDGNGFHLTLKDDRSSLDCVTVKK